MSFTITDARVEKLPSKEKDYVLTDANLSGFAIKITPANKKVFIYKQRLNGKNIKITLDTFPKISCSQARELAKINAGKIAQGINPNEEKKQKIEQAKLETQKKEESKKKSITFREFWAIYDEKYAQITHKAKTKKENAQLAHKRILPYFGDMPLEDISREDILAFERHLTSLNVGKSIFSFCIKGVLRVMFTQAELWGYRAENTNPCRKLSKYQSTKQYKILSEDGIRDFIQYLEERKISANTHIPSLAAIRLYLHGGYRHSELLQLRWQDIDFKNASVHFKDSKTGQKVLPLSKKAIEIFQNIPRKKGCDYIFWSPKKANKPLSSVDRIWKTIKKERGLDVTLHDLRHTFITHVLRKTNNLALASKLAGHSNIQTTMRYTHLATQDLKVGLEKFGEIFD